MKVIGIAGRKGHGKDEFAKVLVEDFGFEIIRFADPLKDMLRELYRHAGLTREAIERRIEGDLKEAPCWVLQGATPRWAMQSLGTEWRDGLFPGKSHVLWAGILLNKVTTMRDIRSNTTRIVVPDLRFPHELDVLNRLNAHTFRVFRPALALDAVDNNHDSERMIDNLDVDHDIRNTGSLDDYRETCRIHVRALLHV